MPHSARRPPPHGAPPASSPRRGAPWRGSGKIPAPRPRAGKEALGKPPSAAIKRRIIKACLAFAVLSLLIWAYNSLDLKRALDHAWLDAQVRALGVWGYPLFILLAAIVTSIAGPRQLMSFAGGYIYGAGLGAALSLAGALIGCAVNFASARLLARDKLRCYLNAHCRRIDAVICRSPFLMTIAVRLLPVGNNTLTSLTAGLSGIPLLPFLAGSAIGYLPMTAVFALLGSGTQIDSSAHIAVGAGLFAASLGLGLYLFKKLRIRT